MEKYTLVPKISTFPDTNPNMFCNLAREDPSKDVCSKCTDDKCIHRGINHIFDTDEHKQKIWDYLKGHGYSNESVAGLMGNMTMVKSSK